MRKALGAGVALTLALGVALGVAFGVMKAGDGPPQSSGCPTALPYTVDRTLFGVSISTYHRSFADAAAELTSTFGSRALVRVFDPDVPPADTWTRQLARLAPGAPVVASFRMPAKEVLAGTYDDRLRHYFDTSPRDRPIFWSYYHEPEAAVASGVMSASEYRAAFRHVADIAAQACRSNLYPTLILTGYTADPASGRDWRDYYPGKAYVSVFAWDPYNSALHTPSSYASPATLFQACARVSAEAGKPWAVAETGSGLVPGDTGAGRAAWLTEIGRYTRATHAAFVAYFDSTDRVDFRLIDAASILAWRRQIDS